jgi:ribonuclease T
VRFDDQGLLEPAESHRFMIKPFAGANLEPASLLVTGIDPFNPLRPAVDEGDALRRLFGEVRKEVKAQD